MPRATVVPRGLELRARGVVVSGLRLHSVTVQLAQVSIGADRPLALRAHRITVRATLIEPDLNSWLADAHLPLRLRLTDAGIQARTGMGGIALGSMDVNVSLSGGVLRLSPQRVAVLGIGLSTAAVPPTPLPLPPLPRAARLTGLSTGRGRVTATLSLPATAVPLGPSALRSVLAMVQSGRATVGAPPRPARARRSSSRPRAAPAGTTPDRIRMVSSQVVEAATGQQEEAP